MQHSTAKTEYFYFSFTYYYYGKAFSAVEDSAVRA